MGRKKKRDQKRTIFCYYCDQTYKEEKTLIQHQRAKHFKCNECGKRLGSAPGMHIHMYQVHKRTPDKVPHALKGRDAFDLDIHGMVNVPEEIIQQKMAEETGFVQPDTKRQNIGQAQMGQPMMMPFGMPGQPFMPMPGMVPNPFMRPPMMPGMPMMMHGGLRPGFAHQPQMMAHQPQFAQHNAQPAIPQTMAQPHTTPQLSGPLTEPQSTHILSHNLQASPPPASIPGGPQGPPAGFQVAPSGQAGIPGEVAPYRPEQARASDTPPTVASRTETPIEQPNRGRIQPPAAIQAQQLRAAAPPPASNGTSSKRRSRRVVRIYDNEAESMEELRAHHPRYAVTSQKFISQVENMQRSVQNTMHQLRAY
eukprot:84592_1